MAQVRIIFPILNHLNPTEDESLGAMMNGLKKLATNGAIKQNIDNVLKDYEIDNSNGYAIAIIDKDDLIDASKLNEIGSSMAPMFELPVSMEDKNLSEYIEGFRNFSAATINERLRLAKADSKLRLRYLIMDYKRYWNTNKNKLIKDHNQLRALRNMFLTDMMGLFSDILPFIEEGKQLSTLLGLNSVTKNMNSMAKDLSMSYKRALKSQKNSGMIPKNQFEKLKVDYNKFMTELLNQIMPGLNDELVGDQGTQVNVDEKQVEHSLVRSFSSQDEQSIIISTTNSGVLSELLNYIKSIGNGGHSFDIVVDPDNEEFKQKFSWDGDGSDRISEVTIIKSKEDSAYSDLDIGKYNDNTSISFELETKDEPLKINTHNPLLKLIYKVWVEKGIIKWIAENDGVSSIIVLEFPNIDLMHNVADMISEYNGNYLRYIDNDNLSIVLSPEILDSNISFTKYNYDSQGRIKLF